MMNGDQEAFQMQRAVWRKSVENDRSRRQTARRRCNLPSPHGSGGGGEGRVRDAKWAGNWEVKKKKKRL